MSLTDPSGERSLLQAVLQLWALLLGIALLLAGNGLQGTLLGVVGLGLAILGAFMVVRLIMSNVGAVVAGIAIGAVRVEELHVHAGAQAARRGLRAVQG